MSWLRPVGFGRVTVDRQPEYLTSLVRELCGLTGETEWGELKVNVRGPEEVREYISARAKYCVRIQLATCILGRILGGGCVGFGSVAPAWRRWPAPGSLDAVSHSGSCTASSAGRSVPNGPVRREPAAIGPTWRTRPARSICRQMQLPPDVVEAWLNSDRPACRRNPRVDCGSPARDCRRSAERALSMIAPDRGLTPLERVLRIVADSDKSGNPNSGILT